MRGASDRTRVSRAWFAWALLLGCNGGPAADPTCQTNAQCAATAFCQFELGVCGDSAGPDDAALDGDVVDAGRGRGRCEPLPAGCYAAPTVPVRRTCGCDGMVYNGGCEAALHSVNVSHYLDDPGSTCP